jgi:hypothetical protein
MIAMEYAIILQEDTIVQIVPMVKYMSQQMGNVSHQLSNTIFC